ncbi:MAG: DUF4386 domain-containing protein [Bryobacteraceae bacterium]|nr:DUF4386 domain-containing protein [Bryobacteraceae bacterium]
MSRALARSQRRAATIAGAAYLIAMALSIYTEGYLRGTLILSHSALATARNLVENTTLFRVSIVLELATFAVDVALIAALHVILTPVNRHLAVYAVLLRMVAETVAVKMAIEGSLALGFLSGAKHLHTFTEEQLATLARLALASHDSSYAAVFVFLGLGSTVFAYLWLRSGFVPRLFGVLGIVASLLLSGGSVAFIIEPSVQSLLYPWYMIPMFFFEVGLGLWLLSRGLQTYKNESGDY